MRLIKDGEKGRVEGGMEVRENEIIYLSLHCHHKTDSCINYDGYAAMKAILMFH